MILIHRSYLPSFKPDSADYEVLIVLTVLSVNDEVLDCRAYRGIVQKDFDESVMAEIVRAGGEKVSEEEARLLFYQIETMKLRYRR